MSALSSQSIRSLRGAAPPHRAEFPRVRHSAPLSFEVLWMNAVSFLSLAAIAVLVVYLVLRS